MKKSRNKIFYDKKTDVLWMWVKSGVEEKHQEISPGISVELDKQGNLLGIEILHASRVLGPKLGISTPPQSSGTILHKIKH